MRVVMFRSYGTPAEVLELDEVPTPPTPGPEELLVRVLLRPVHHGDLLGPSGAYRSPGDTSQVPIGGKRPGFEGYGIVEQAGAGGNAPAMRPGARVAFFPAPGAWSEHALVSAAHATPIPHAVPDEIAAQLHVNPLTAAILIRAAEAAGVVPGGGTLVLTAAGGGVAKLTIALALERRLPVVALVRSETGAEALRRLFPALIVIATAHADWRHQLNAGSGGQIQAVLDPVGGSLASRLLDELASGGSLVSYGSLSGQPIVAPALSFSTRDIRISGVSVGRWAGEAAEVRAADIATALSLARTRPDLFNVAATYDLAAVADAAAHVERPNKDGTILLSSYDQDRSLAALATTNHASLV